MAYNTFSPIVTNGLVLCLDAGNTKSYPGNGTSWLDLSSNSLNGTLVGSPVYSPSNAGSFVFDGTNKSISVPKLATFVNVSQLSMCAWMKRTLSNSAIIISQVESLANDVAFELWNDGYAYFEVGNSQNSYGRVLNNSTSWQFLAMSYNGSLSGNSNRLKAYINGVEQTLDFSGTTIPATTGTVNANFVIGSYLIGSTYGNGNISNVLVYNRAITPDEILQNYNSMKVRFI